MESRKIQIVRMEDDEKREHKVLRAGIYARYSSVGNSPYSAEEQIQRIRYRLSAGIVKSRRYPMAEIQVDEAWVIKDEAKTGRVTREGYELIKSGITTKAFDIVLMDDISRMSRDMGDTLDLYEALVFSEVEGISVADNISTVDDNARDLFIFKGYANEHQSKATSKNTIRGLEIRALGGYSTGHTPYGYYSVATKKAMIKGIEKPSHFEIKIDYEQSLIVQKIWQLYSEGQGTHAIATQLNNGGVLAPSRSKVAKEKRTRWSEKTVWNILHQEKYVAVWSYRKTKVIKNPYMNKLAQKDRPKTEWIVTQREDLRIISKELEEKVSKRKAEAGESRIKTGARSNFGLRGNTPKHLFIGTMKCGVCGDNFILVSGTGGGYLGCWRAHRETIGSCTNKVMIKMSTVEWHLIDEIKRHLDKPDTYEYLAKKYNEIMRQKHGEVPQRLAQLEEAVSGLEQEVQNYLKFVGQGHQSDAVVGGLREAEKRLETLRAERDYLRGQDTQKVYITPHVIRSRLAGLDDVLGQKTAEANMVLRRLFPEKIAMNPVQVEKSKTYEASGVLNLYSLSKFRIYEFGVPYEIRTRVYSVKGRPGSFFN